MLQRNEQTRREAIGLGMAALGVALALGPGLASTASAAEPAAQTVRLVIDFGDGAELHFTKLPWRKDMTVLEALTAVGTHRRRVAHEQRGSGGSALITQIGDLKNGGGGAQSRNWMYYVNGKQATTSAGAQPLKPDDVALWKFQVYDYNP